MASSFFLSSSLRHTKLLHFGIWSCGLRSLLNVSCRLFRLCWQHKFPEERNTGTSRQLCRFHDVHVCLLVLCFLGLVLCFWMLFVSRTEHHTLELYAFRWMHHTETDRVPSIFVNNCLLVWVQTILTWVYQASRFSHYDDCDWATEQPV